MNIPDDFKTIIEDNQIFIEEGSIIVTQPFEVIWELIINYNSIGITILDIHISSIKGKFKVVEYNEVLKEIDIDTNYDRIWRIQNKMQINNMNNTPLYLNINIKDKIIFIY